LGLASRTECNEASEKYGFEYGFHVDEICSALACVPMRMGI
jgi:hypothetical protein